MTTTNFLIGPINDALRKDVKPFATPEDSFETLTNAYQFRGRIVRRSGYDLLGTLANGTPVMGLKTQELFAVDAQALIAFDETDAYLYNGSAFVPLPTFYPVTWNGTDSDFFYSINYANAFWATNNVEGLNGYKIQAFSGAITNTSVMITAAGNNFVLGDQIYTLNVTGPTFAADNLRFGTVTTAGNPFTFTTTDGGAAFVNGGPASGIALSSTRQTPGQDGIRYYGDLTNAGGAGIGNSWANYSPPVDPNNALVGALLIFAYRGYLVFLNTTEGNDGGTYNYPNRARWTQIGTPYYSYPVPVFPNPQTVDPKAARDDLFGRGGANDAPTNEAIVSAGFIRDILIVFFERSTWRLRFVNNSQNPFVWERVNIELGSDCTFSAITFDKGLMAIGNRGIVISDGNDTKRFDEKIPNEIFTIRQDNEGFKRVQSIRTFRTRLCYWTFPLGENPSGIYPDAVLVYNYDTGNWSFFDDSFTTFGYYYPSSGSATTWNDLTDAWSSYDTETAEDGITQTGFETIIAGNQQGFVFKLEQTSTQNDPSLNITAITLSSVGPPFTPTIITSPDHNLPDGTWIYLTGVTGTTSSDGVSLNGRNFKISVLDPITDINTFTINEFESIDAGAAVGSRFPTLPVAAYTIEFVPILAGSMQVNVGTLVFTDGSLNGVLNCSDMLSSGTINYTTGAMVLNFATPIVSTEVYIRYVSAVNLPSIEAVQSIDPVQTIGAYTGGGQIGKISNFDIQTKLFNFFKGDQRSRLSKIDFYTNNTDNGQFTCNIFADSNNIPVNVPFFDAPQSNVVLTHSNPYQFSGQYSDQSIFRLYANAIGQSLQFQFMLSDQQMAVDAINSEDVQILAMIVSMTKGGRII